jgi:DNA-binding MarR family transcriptional regulator
VPARPDPLETSLLFDVFALNQAVSRLLDEAMRDGPLTPAEYAAYSAIFELEAASPTELAGRLGMRLTTFVDRLRVIERRGHARRVSHPTDGRSYRVVLTTDGLAAHRAANVLFERAAAGFKAKLGSDGRSAGATLRALREAADAARLEPVSPRPRVDRGG